MTRYMSPVIQMCFFCPSNSIVLEKIVISEPIAVVSLIVGLVRFTVLTID